MLYSTHTILSLQEAPLKEAAHPDPTLLAAKANLEQAAAFEPSDSDGLGGKYY